MATVGIGTTSPSGLLHIRENDTGSGSKTLLYLTSKTGGGSPTDQHGPAIEFQTQWGTNGNFWKTAKIIGTVYNSGGGGALRFFTAASGGASGGYSVNSPVERMMIDRNGNVGIGVKSPLCTLNTHNILSSSHNTLPNDGSALPNTTSLFLGKGTSSTENYWGLILGTLYNGRSYIQTYHKNSSSASYPLLLQPTNGGNVGIGTSTYTPEHSLDVGGSGGGIKSLFVPLRWRQKF